MGRVQRGVSMGQVVWDKVYTNFRRFGFKTHSLLIESCVLYVFRHKYSEELSKSDKEHLKTYEEVGKIAESVKPLIFMGKASETYEDAKRNYEKNVKLGLMTQSSMEKNLKRLAKRLKSSIAKTDKDQDKKDVEEHEKHKRTFAKKHGLVVTKSGKIRKA